MQGRGRLAVHPTPCSGLRSCGPQDRPWCRARDGDCDYPDVAHSPYACIPAFPPPFGALEYFCIKSEDPLGEQG